MPRIVCEMVGVFVIRHAPGGWEFLLLKRAPGRYMADTWHPVYGAIEPNETTVQTALRELREETALTPTALYALNGVETFFIAAKDEIHHCPTFVAEVPADAEPSLNDENTTHKWVPAAEIDHHLLWPSQRRAAAETIQEIMAPGPAKRYIQIEIR
jgi:dATP pyrophosphohydrolase